VNSKQLKSIYRKTWSSSNEHIFVLLPLTIIQILVVRWIISSTYDCVLTVDDRQVIEEFCQTYVIHISVGDINGTESTDDDDEHQRSKIRSLRHSCSDWQPPRHHIINLDPLMSALKE